MVKRYGDNLQTDSLAYSANSRVITAIAAVGTGLDTETTYLNVRGQPDSVKTHLYWWDYWRRYAYTADGLLDSIWGQGSNPPFLSRKYRYNTGTGTLDSIRLGGALTRLTLNGDLQPTYATFPGGDQTIRAFTSSHGDMRISASVAYDTATDRRITYNAAGRLWRQLRFEQPAGYGGGHLYGYDPLGRLIADTVVRTDNDQFCTGTDPHFGVVCTDFWSSWWALSGPTYYSYDTGGNRNDNGGSYTTGNRISTFGSCTYSNNPDGTRLRNYCPGTNVGFEWDALGRLKWVMFDDNGPQWTDTVKFYYDAAGRLIRRDRNGTILNYYLWDGDNLYAELYGPGEHNGNKLAEYSYYPGLDQLHSVVIGDTAYYAHTDGMGNVVALTGADQGLKKTYTYLPWGTLYNWEDYAGLAGRERARWKGALSFGEHGAEFYYLRNRWYEPSTGRFLSEDPIGLQGGINPYTFAANDPVNGRDPTGQTYYMDWYSFIDAWLWVNYGVSLQGALLTGFNDLGFHVAGEFAGISGGLQGTGCKNEQAVSFVRAHQSDAATVAQDLSVPTQNVLGLSAIESAYGTSNAALYANNFFGLHGGADAPFATGVWHTSKGTAMSSFPSYLASAQSFAAQWGSYVQGIGDSYAFAHALFAAGFNPFPVFVTSTANAINATAGRMQCP